MDNEAKSQAMTNIRLLVDYIGYADYLVNETDRLDAFYDEVFK